ncbi:hypothetical protein GCM10010249_60590 [Streptomyces roseolilacinus]|uniref:Insertion element IS402-like domain-containing protein n=1 Tax=Streptomyces roseolilacinus TaxID=66904 RepID=A0A918B6F9_9ACTN|nr:hypothetical protein GCM10010249_60590 [Streptomyces roseolilacinus]
MGRGTWSWIVPDGLWEIAKPLIPPSKVRPQGGGTQDTPDETLFAAIIYVLVSGCAWRALPPCFGVSKSTAHRRFLIWSRAGVWGRLHEEILHRLNDASLLDLSRAVLDSAHVRTKRGTNSQVRAPWTGQAGFQDAHPVGRERTALLAGISAANTHDSQALKPMVLGHQTRHDPTTAATSSPNACTPTRPTTSPTCGNGFAASASASGSHAKASSRQNVLADAGG